MLKTVSLWTLRERNSVPESMSNTAISPELGGRPPHMSVFGVRAKTAVQAVKGRTVCGSVRGSAAVRRTCTPQRARHTATCSPAALTAHLYGSSSYVTLASGTTASPDAESTISLICEVEIVKIVTDHISAQNACLQGAVAPAKPGGDSKRAVCHDCFAEKCQK